MEARHIEPHLKDPYTCLNHNKIRPTQSISVGGGIKSIISLKKLAGKLWTGGRHGVMIKRDHLGIVNTSSSCSSLKGDASTYTALPTSPSTELVSDDRAAAFPASRLLPGSDRVEEAIEKTIFNCRFFTLMGIAGSLAGSVLCFLKGCTFVFDSFKDYFQSWLYGHGSGVVILRLLEAIDVYLTGTVMLILGMGLYELFVSSLVVQDQTSTPQSSRATAYGSNLFGLFALQERPKWLEIKSLDELKTKLGHVIVMILLVGMFEKSKKVPINSGLDLLYFSGSVLLLSSCLFLLSKLKSRK